MKTVALRARAHELKQNRDGVLRTRVIFSDFHFARCALCAKSAARGWRDNILRMRKTIQQVVAACLMSLVLVGAAPSNEPGNEDGFEPIFDGKSLDGWKSSDMTF